MMESISTDPYVSTKTPAINMPGVSEPSFVEALVSPASVFRDSEEVGHHPWFTHEEKRTILLSWVRDELVLEQLASKALPELRPKSRIDAVIKALAQFDSRAAGEYCSAAASIRAHHLGSSFKRKRITLAFVKAREGKPHAGPHHRNRT